MGDINSTGRKIVCSIISVIIAFCLCLSISGVVASGVLKSQEFVAERLLKCTDILLEDLNKKDEELLPQVSSFPVKAFTDSVGEGHMKTALLRASGNIVFGYKTDFSDSSYLFSYYKTGLTSYCKANNIIIDDKMEDTINKDSSIAVDIFNQVCGDEATNFIIPFQEAHSSISIKVSIVCAIIILICALSLKRLNYGDYFMFSYGGMAVIVAGALMIVLPVFCLVMGYSNLFDFTDVRAYNLGIQYCIDDVLRILSITGAVLTLVGIITMNVVFNRYRGIVYAIQTEMNIAEKLRKEYMEEQMQYEMEQGIIDESDVKKHQNDKIDNLEINNNRDIIEAKRKSRNKNYK